MGGGWGERREREEGKGLETLDSIFNCYVTLYSIFNSYVTIPISFFNF